VYRAKISGGLSLTQNFCNFPEQRTEILLHNPLKPSGVSGASARQLRVDNPRIQRIVGDVIEMRSGIRQNFFAWGKAAVQRGINRVGQPAENVVEHGAIKRLFVLEVVIKQSLVHMRAAGNGVGTRSGDPFPSKFLRSGVQNGSAAFFRLSPRTKAG